jgi:hypothetical protein
MPRVPAPANPGRGVSRSGAPPEPDCWEPVITCPDPVSLEEWLAWDADEDEPPGFCEDDLDPEGSALPWGEDLAAIVAETDQVMAERAADAEFLARPQTAELAGAVLADEARRRGPRGPGLPGSAERVPGVSSGPAGGFGAGECLDVVPGSAGWKLITNSVRPSRRSSRLPRRALTCREPGSAGQLLFSSIPVDVDDRWTGSTAFAGHECPRQPARA